MSTGEVEEDLSNKMLHTTTREHRGFISGEPAMKRARLSKGHLYKPPTNEEMNQLKETENLFHSTLFRLQITELLSEVRLKDQRRLVMQKATEELITILQGLPAGTKHELQDQKWLKKKMCRVPIVQEPWEVKGKFHFIPPSEVKLIGSFPLDMCVKPHVHVDLVATMPKACFDSQDFMNHRYLRKRALYLCFIAQKLSKMDMVEDLKFMYHHGNHMKPILFVMMKVEGHSGVKFQLHAVPDVGYFRLNRFDPGKGNVRAQWFHGQASDTVPDVVATPHYNSCIAGDLTVDTNQACLAGLDSTSHSLQEGVMLLKVWLRQRQLAQGYGGFSGFIMSLYVAYLLSQRRLNLQMSSYQVMRNTLRWLAQSDWTKEGISLCTDTADPNQPVIADFHLRFDVVFIDTTGYLNVCSSMNKFTFHRVKLEAQLAMDILDDKTQDCFHMLFMTSVEFTHKFDHVFHISLSDDVDRVVDRLAVRPRLLDLGGHYIPACVPAILDRLQAGLGARVQLIQLQLVPPQMWDIREAPPGRACPGMLTFGLLLDSQLAHNVLDKGPPAETPEAAEFQEVWGGRSELRRFQDGSICEAVVWGGGPWPVNTTRLICQQIVTYILDRHASIPSTSVQYVAGQADNLLHVAVHQGAGTIPYGTGEEQTAHVNRAFDGLCKLVRGLANLPLTITSIQGVSPCFRHTEVFPPMPATFQHREDRQVERGEKRYIPKLEKPCPPYTHALRVICTLEGSGKWPDDYAAMQRLKAAFHLQLGELLQSHCQLPVRMASDHIDVLKDHYMFRLVLAYTKEIAMLKTMRTADGMVRKRDTDAALQLELDTVILPKLTSTLHGLQQQHNSFSTTARLSKRWVAAQLLAMYIDEVAVELIVASLYISPSPYSPPSSGMAGFLRFLQLLSTHDWTSTPLMVNLNADFKAADWAEIPMRFSKERTTLPLMFISTPMGRYSSHWTKHGPSAPVLQRLVLLAQRSLGVIQAQIGSGLSLDMKQIYRPPLDMYDLLIHLKMKQLPRQHEAVDISMKTYIPSYGKSVDEDRLPVTDFDPVQFYLRDLQDAFADLAMFFHDKHGGDVIGVLWKPQLCKPTDFKGKMVAHSRRYTFTIFITAKNTKVSHINYSRPLTGKGVQLMPNMEAILEDMKIMGEGLVDTIEVKGKQT